jgi:hypothetical protein
VCAQLPAGLRPLGAYAAASGGEDAAALRACEEACAALGDGAAVVALASADGALAFRSPAGAPLSPAPLPDAWLADTLAALRCRVSKLARLRATRLRSAL